MGVSNSSFIKNSAQLQQPVETIATVETVVCGDNSCVGVPSSHSRAQLLRDVTKGDIISLAALWKGRPPPRAGGKEPDLSQDECGGGCHHLVQVLSQWGPRSVDSPFISSSPASIRTSSIKQAHAQVGVQA